MIKPLPLVYAPNEIFKKKAEIIETVDDDSASFEEEDMDDKFDYMAGSADIYVSDDHSDLNEEQIFGKEDTDLEDKGF